MAKVLFWDAELLQGSVIVRRFESCLIRSTANVLVMALRATRPLSALARRAIRVPLPCHDSDHIAYCIAVHRVSCPEARYL